MYILRRPSRASARSWYSRLATCTSKALATRVAGSSWEICKIQGSSRRFRLFWGTSVSTLMRPKGVPDVSSKPSIISRLSLFLTCLSWAAEGLSGRMANRDWPAVAMRRPSALQRTASLASIFSRTRSSMRAALASGTSTNCWAAKRDWRARSLDKVSKVARPKLRPATKAPSTFTSNQLSMERETN